MVLCFLISNSSHCLYIGEQLPCISNLVSYVLVIKVFISVFCCWFFRNSPHSMSCHLWNSFFLRFSAYEYLLFPFLPLLLHWLRFSVWCWTVMKADVIVLFPVLGEMVSFLQLSMMLAVDFCICSLQSWWSFSIHSLLRTFSQEWVWDFVRCVSLLNQYNHTFSLFWWLDYINCFSF